LQLKPKPLIIKVNVDGAVVFINNKYYGLTPLKKLKLLPGFYTVQVKKDGYFPFERQIDLQQAKTLRVKLLPKPNKLIINKNINMAVSVASTLTEHNNPVSSVAFSPKGDLFASGGQTVKL